MGTYLGISYRDQAGFILPTVMATAESSLAPAEPSTLFKKRAPKKSIVKKRPATPPSDDDTSTDSAFTDDEGRQVKRRRKAGGITAASTAPRERASDAADESTFAAQRSSKIESTNDATKHSDWFDESTQTDTPPGGRRSDAVLKSNDADVYRGAANYRSHIQRNPDAPTRAVGPMRAPANVRASITTDTSPGICKDYKQTGFCGFGDSCIYMHDRADYKQGWQLDREWEKVTQGQRLTAGGQVVARRAGDRHAASGTVAGADDEEEALLEGIPFACIICKQDYKNPIKTRCGHYFCEACVLKRYKNGKPNCEACGASTGGVFNDAKVLRKLLARKREQAARQDDSKGEEPGGNVE